MACLGLEALRVSCGSGRAHMHNTWCSEKQCELFQKKNKVYEYIKRELEYEERMACWNRGDREREALTRGMDLSRLQARPRAALCTNMTRFPIQRDTHWLACASPSQKEGLLRHAQGWVLASPFCARACARCRTAE